MYLTQTVFACFTWLCVSLAACLSVAQQSSSSTSNEESIRPTLRELKASGLARSRYRESMAEARLETDSQNPSGPAQPDTASFLATIQPLLIQHCVDCHGPDTAEGNVRIDTLNPDLSAGGDTDWWLEVLSVVTKGEMPPADSATLEDHERQAIVDWLSRELQVASLVRQRSGGHSSFRRLTRYEYNYALQDLLGLPWDFAKDLPPEAQSKEGFQNSSNLLHLSASQFASYHRIARNALGRAMVQGDKPATLFWDISMEAAAAREWPKHDALLEQLHEKLHDNPEELAAELERQEASFQNAPRGAYYKNLSNGRTAKAVWDYHGAKYAFAPQPQMPEFRAHYDSVAILPAKQNARLIVELGNQLPDHGTMRVRVRVSRTEDSSGRAPSLQLLFGWQASNEGRALLPVSPVDIPITAGPDQPQIVEWDVELSELYPRNSVRKTSPMGITPSPSEYIRLVNSSASAGDIRIECVQVAAPVYDQWPPESHRRIFDERNDDSDELAYARKTIGRFMERAWRRPIGPHEIERKLALFTNMRAECDTTEDAVAEVLATVLSSPQFLYLLPSVTVDEGEPREIDQELDVHQLACRLSFFLWCSLPDDQLLSLARDGSLAEEDVLLAQVDRMLNDPRSTRFAKHFVQQWLNMQLLEFLNFKQHVRNFDPLLKHAMQREPVELFRHMLGEDASILDLLHSNYAIVNERLAQHYGLADVYGNHFRRVELHDGFRRGGLLTQAGLLAMNSDWPDSHPLKRAIWLLECLLDDPPPPPPPAVPQIDLADPAIAKMTLKERIEDHRNHAACMSCHIKIDPWGIAFENYDALGQWRDELNGKTIDATSRLFNQQELAGMDGLKRFLLEHRQDQFVRALVSKLTMYAVGRPLTFADHAEIDKITSHVRKQGDGLRSAIKAIVQSKTFQSW